MPMRLISCCRSFSSSLSFGVMMIDLRPMMLKDNGTVPHPVLRQHVTR